MIDVTPQLVAYVAALPGWSLEDSRRTLAAISRALGLTVDWDDGAGEAWARLVAGDRIAALVSMAGPLVLALDDVAVKAGRSVGVAVPVVAVVAMDDPVLTCDATTMAAAFGEWPRLATLDAAGFSVADLWFATV